MVPRISQEALIIRLSKIYSTQSQDSTMLFDLGTRLLQGQDIKAAFDLYFNPICIGDVYQGLLTLIKGNCSGLYHLSGQETTSWYDLAVHLAKELEIPSHKIEKVSIDQFSPNAMRAKNLNMQPSRLIQEFPNFKFSTLETNIKKAKEQLLLSVGQK